MQLWRRIAFGVCGLILILPLWPLTNVYLDTSFKILGGAYILIALFWPGKKDESG